MSLDIIKCDTFNQRYSKKYFDILCNFFQQVLCSDSERAVLIGGYRLEGYAIDAMLIGNYGVVAFRFVDIVGRVIANESGFWSVDGNVLPMGVMSSYPTKLYRKEYQRLEVFFQQSLKIDFVPLHLCVLVGETSQIVNQLDRGTCEWLHVHTLSQLSDLWQKLNLQSVVLSSQMVELLIESLDLRGIEKQKCEDFRYSEDVQAKEGAKYYEELGNLLHSDTLSYNNRYAVLRDIFRRIIDQGTENCHLYFSNRFAKLDYLLHEAQMPIEETQSIHRTRQSLTHSLDEKEDYLASRLSNDIANVARVVSLVYGKVSIPKNLLVGISMPTQKHKWDKFDQRVIKCICSSWDDSFIEVTEQQHGERMRVCYGMKNRYLTREGVGDWEYLKTILWPGAQLNLVRPRFEGEVCLPELIILEPDYLINVTTVASCFESYAESPFVNLLNKIKPQNFTKHTFLGLLSGMYLDDTVHQRKVEFKEGLQHFFHEHAVSLAACQDLANSEDMAWLINQAEIQQQNIEQLIGRDLPNVLKDYDSNNSILEPTFFSPVLGLQGRLDFLYEKNENTVIIEQKSGKKAYSAIQNAENVIPQEKHLVQLILYRAIFAYEMGRHASQLQHVMLLYSKYANGLVAVGPNSQLLLRAIKMRNLLAWSELLYAKDGFRILENFTAEKFNKKQLKGILWEQYIHPQLDDLLRPLHEASDLERSYFFRFMRFIATEQLLSKIGNKEKEGSGFASLWNDTLEEKKMVGNIYDELTIDSVEGENGEVFRVRLSFSKQQTVDTSNFRRGDIVVLYSYERGNVPSAVAQMVHRASIIDITLRYVDVALRNRQTDEAVFWRDKTVRWAIEHDLFESSFQSLYRGMYMLFLSNQQRRNLLLFQRKPKIDTSRKRKGEYGNFNTLVERAKQADDIFIIIGPPGTGKTSFGLLNVLKEGLLETGTNILLLSYTNRAVDEICSKLKEQQIDFVRLGSDLSVETCYQDNLLSERVKKYNNRADVKEMIMQARVFCATTSTMNANLEILSMKTFDLAIVDESSQILEPHLIPLFSAQVAGKPSIHKFVFIGDHKQLPAVVQQDENESRVMESELRKIHLIDCRLSLFERFLAWFKSPNGYDSRFVYILKRQGRMHREIAKFPNEAFYGGMLDVVPLNHQLGGNLSGQWSNGIAQILSRKRVLFVSSPGTDELLSSKSNPIEAEMIAATVAEIYKMTVPSFNPDKTVGIIVPYRNQIATVRNVINRYEIADLSQVTIDTVERYQGSQRDYILYGFTVQHPYQLKFLTNNVFEEDGRMIDRKLNVAMTRARERLVLFGNPSVLQKNVLFTQLMDFVRKEGGYIDVDWKVYCRGDFSVSEDCKTDNSQYEK